MGFIEWQKKIKSLGVNRKKSLAAAFPIT